MDQSYARGHNSITTWTSVSNLKLIHIDTPQYINVIYLRGIYLCLKVVKKFLVELKMNNMTFSWKRIPN